MSSSSIGRPETMSQFFDLRADGYERHMQETVSDFAAYYQTVSQPIAPTDQVLEILDLGCGTGLEIAGILAKAPKAHITCVDLSSEMLRILQEKYSDFRQQLTLVEDSYVTMPLGRNQYDYVVSVMTMHHFPPEQKAKLYQKIKESLRANGRYIEGDYVVSREEAAQLMAEYQRVYHMNDLPQEKLYHIDIPLTLEDQERLLLKAGFHQCNVIWLRDVQAIYYAE